MSHWTMERYFHQMRDKYPHNFHDITAVDFGSLEVNASLRTMFVRCKYTGVDICPGKNVDVVSRAHEYICDPIDTAVSGSMLEHDEYWMESLRHMYRLLKEGGLLVVSAAGPAWPPHGVRSCPGEGGQLWGTDPDYYETIDRKKFQCFLDSLSDPPKEYQIQIQSDGRDDENGWDAFFYAVKSTKKRKEL